MIAFKYVMSFVIDARRLSIYIIGIIIFTYTINN